MPTSQLQSSEPYTTKALPCSSETTYYRTYAEEKNSPEWHDWKWQFRNRLTTLEALETYLPLQPKERKAFLTGGKNLPFAITPYYLDLMISHGFDGPLRKTVVPQLAEFITNPNELVDPCGEDAHMPVPGLVHRYPDRVLFLVNETCSVYCRYCTRSRLVGSGSHRVAYAEVYDYLRQHPEVRDVLLSGGDPLVMSDQRLADILENLRAIPSIEIVRIGTKIPVVMPQRVTPALVETLKRFHPLYMSLHVLHPDELTPEAAEAFNRLADAGIPTFSQTVLLQGVNDDPAVMKRLVHQLLKLRVRPYYLYQCDPVQGTSHFRTPIQTGIDIIEQLRGHTTGYGIPTFVVDAPGGGGKVPVSPEYVLSYEEGVTTLRNFQNKIYTYHDV